MIAVGRIRLSTSRIDSWSGLALRFGIIGALVLSLLAFWSRWHHSAEAAEPELRVQAPAKDGAKDQDKEELVTEASTRELMSNRASLARKALELISRRTTQGTLVDKPIPEAYRWSLRLLGAEIYLSMADDEVKVADPEVYLAVAKARFSEERLGAFRDHLARMKVWEDRWRALMQKNYLSPFEFMEVQNHVLEAELWLARERLKEHAGQAKNGAPAPKSR
jgi:hypothetical protein